MFTSSSVADTAFSWALKATVGISVSSMAFYQLGVFFFEKSSSDLSWQEIFVGIFLVVLLRIIFWHGGSDWRTAHLVIVGQLWVLLGAHDFDHQGPSWRWALFITVGFVSMLYYLFRYEHEKQRQSPR